MRRCGQSVGGKVGRRLLYATVTLALFFALAEGVLAWMGVRPVLVDRDPFQGFSRRVRVWELDPERARYRTPRRAIAHSFNYQEFEAVKPPNGFRFFVLGGSSAFGFPWGAAVAFPALLGRALQSTWPEKKVEAVNAAAMSYGSHRLRIVATEVLGHEPDLLIVYGGHNEFVERRFYSDFIARPSELDRLRAWLAHSRVYALMARAYEGLRDGDRVATETTGVSRSTGELLGLDVDREDPVDVGPAEVEEVRRLFEQNLQAILDRAHETAVPVVLCTVPSNLRDWRPNRSRFDSRIGFEDRQTVLGLIGDARAALESGEASAALSALERAQQIAPEYAEVHFLLGRAHEALGHPDAAREAHRRARDTDAQPSRATTEINATIRDLAERNDVLLFDAERLFEQTAPDGLVGFDLLEDYVHPTPRGHLLIAEGLWRLLLSEASPEDGPRDLDFSAALDAASPPTEDPSGPGAAPASDNVTPTLLFNLAVVLENQGAIAEAKSKYRAALAMHPGFAIARANLAGLLYEEGRFAEAAEEYRRALRDNPRHAKTMVALGEALNSLGELEEAERVLREATSVDPASAEAWNSLGSVLIRQSRVTEAEASFRRATELDPGSADAAANLGYSLLFQNRIEEAHTTFERGIALQADHLRSRDGLGAVLTELGRLDEAERIFRENLTVDPDDSVAKAGLDRIAGLRGR